VGVWLATSTIENRPRNLTLHRLKLVAERNIAARKFDQIGHAFLLRLHGRGESKSGAESNAGGSSSSSASLSIRYAAFRRGADAERRFAAELERLNAVRVDVPADLEGRVRAYLAAHPMATWDDAVQAVLDEER
jgi:hypothetical protein